MTDTPPRLEMVDAITRELIPPETSDIEQLIEWQQRLRDAVDNHIAANLSRPFSTECERRFGDSSEAKSSLSKWANDVLRRIQIYIRCIETGRSGFMCYTRGGQWDSGRIRLHLHGMDKQRTTTLRPPFDFQLIAPREHTPEPRQGTEPQREVGRD